MFSAILVINTYNFLISPLGIAINNNKHFLINILHINYVFLIDFKFLFINFLYYKFANKHIPVFYS